MTPLKKVDRSATICFDPTGTFLAAGSVAGAIDLSFSTSSTLEIFDLDLGSSYPNLKPAGGAVQAPERFSRLCWGPGADADTYPRGLLAGGLADGSICLWDPARIVGRAAGPKESQPLARLQKHRGAVRGLEFNPFSPSLLASGGVDGELCIWDMAKPASPSLYPAMRRSGSVGSSLATDARSAPEVSHLAWNGKVQHILATATLSGGVVVWDLKKQRPVITLGEGGGGGYRRRAAAVRWNPELAVQVAVASDDDAAPGVALWDLRNAVSPVREYVGHTRGVAGLAWCPQDPGLLLSSGRDGRTIVWDVAEGAGVVELPTRAAWDFDVAWVPGASGAGLFAAATLEGQVALHSLARCVPVPAPVDPNTGCATGPGLAHSRAPVWLRRPAGAAFGFGGKLARFGPRVDAGAGAGTIDPAAQVLAPVADGAGSPAPGSDASGAAAGVNAGGRVLQVLQVRAGSAAAAVAAAAVGAGHAAELRDAVASGDRDALRALCERREAGAADAAEAETWAFLGAHYAGDARRYLLERLGFGEDLAKLEAEAAAATAAAAAVAQATAAAADDAPATLVPDATLDPGALSAGLHALGLSGGDGVEGSTSVPGPDNKGQDFFAAEGTDSFFDDLNSPVVSSPMRPGHPSANGAAGGPPGLSPLGGAREQGLAGRGTDAVAAGLAASEHGAGTGGAVQLDDTLDVALESAEGGEAEAGILRALVLGDPAAAAATAGAAGRHADAVLLASLVGGDAFLKARLEYMASAPAPYMRVVAAQLRGDWARLVRSRPASAWRETLALLLSAAPAVEFESLARELGGVLETAGAPHAAALCAVAAGDLEAAAAEWGRHLPRAAPPAALEAVVEKALMLSIGTDSSGGAGTSPALAALLARYADALVADGDLAGAVAFLDLLPAEPGSAVADLRDRILNAAPLPSAAGASPPPAYDAQAPTGYDAYAPQDEFAQQMQQPAPVSHGGYDFTSAQQAYNFATGVGVVPNGPGTTPSYANAAPAAGYGTNVVSAPASGYANAAPVSGYATQAYGTYGAPAAPAPQPQLQQQAAAGPAVFTPPAMFAPASGPSAGPPPMAPPTSFAPQPLTPNATQAFSAPAATQTFAPPTFPQRPPTSGLGPSSPQAYAAPPPQPQPYAAPEPAPTTVFAVPGAVAGMPAAAPPPVASAPQTFAAPPGPQTFAAPPGPQTFAAPPGPQTYAAPPAPQTYAAPPAPQTYAAPPAPQTFAAPGPPNSLAPSVVGMGAPQAATYAPPAATFSAAPPGRPSAPSAAPSTGGSVPGSPARGPGGPPPGTTLLSVDPSAASPASRAVLASLSALYRACESAYAAQPGRARELDDAAKRLGLLAWRLVQGGVSEGVAAKLAALCAALDSRDWAGAVRVQAVLTREDWDETSAWLSALKRLIKLRQALG